MRFKRRRFLIAGAASALLRATRAAAETPPADANDPRPPTPVEEALIQRHCDALRLRADGLGTHDQCLDEGLASLRADFGYDLGLLSASERRKLDATCSGGRPEGREAYLDCLDAGLRSLRDRWDASNPGSPRPAATAKPSGGSPLVSLPAPAVRKTSRAWLIIAFALGVPILIAGGTFLLLRRRSPFPLRRRPPVETCRTCGAELGDAGDLCAACRHQAAEALRQAASERAMRPQMPPNDEQQRRRREQTDAQELDETRHEEDAGQRQQKAGCQPADAPSPAAAAGALTARDDGARVETSSTA